ESKYENPIQTTIVADAIDVDGYVIDFRQGDRTPFIDYNIDVTDPANFLVTEVRDRPNEVLNQFQTGQIAFEWDLSDAFSFDAGFSYKQFKFKSYEERRDTVLAPGDVFPLTGSNSLIVG